MKTTYLVKGERRKKKNKKKNKSEMPLKLGNKSGFYHNGVIANHESRISS